MAVLRLCAKAFRKTFGQRVPRGWRSAWWQAFARAALLEHETRKLMRDINRLRPQSVATKVRTLFRRVGIDPAQADFFSREVSILPPLTRLLLLQFMPNEGPMKPVALTTLKNERYPAGAFPDLTNLDAFVIATFEAVARDAGAAAWQLPGAPPVRRRYEDVYLTDHELAVLSFLLNPDGVTIHKSDLKAHTSPGMILDRHRHNISNKRRVHGFLHTSIPNVPREQIQERKQKIQQRLEEEAARREAGPHPEIPWPLSVERPTVELTRSYRPATRKMAT